MLADFKEVFKIMSESFPDSEMRSYEGQLALLDEKNYRLITEKDEHNKIISFMTTWELEDFYFIEHLATSKNLRGKGVGSKLLKEYLNKATKPVILEVEPDDNYIAKRRVEFYTRLGFYINRYNYQQPALQKNTEPCKLYIMSYPKELTKDEFIYYSKTLYQKVYKTKFPDLEP